MAGRKRMAEADRFMLHVQKLKSGCWAWTAFRMKTGYGHFRTKHGHELAHRASYRLFIGAIEPKKLVIHSCDNPSCVSPKHLSLGTQFDNMGDAKKKGRMAVGQSHGRSKLTEKDALFAKFSPLKQRVVAGILGITQSHISEIRSGKRWAYLSTA